MIDLHTHTTASDGTLRPSALVARAAAAGITTLSVTDHDTVGGLDEARAAAASSGITFVDGIEVTAVEGGRDVHVLGYFFDPAHPALVAFLERQRQDRVRRVREIAERLASLGAPIDTAPLVRRGTDEGRTVGRPHVAAALVAAGHVRSPDEAFERYLERTRPAFVPRIGTAAADVVGILTSAGGVASLAHPAVTRIDDLIPSLILAGLGAIEARHSDHDAADETRYRQLAARCGLAVSGGSDYHGDGGHHRGGLGRVSLTPGEFAALEARRP